MSTRAIKFDIQQRNNVHPNPNYTDCDDVQPPGVVLLTMISLYSN